MAVTTMHSMEEEPRPSFTSMDRAKAREIGRKGGRHSRTRPMSPEARARLYGAMAALGETPLSWELYGRPAIKMEVYNAEKGVWAPVAEVPAGATPGSLSHNHERERDVYIFGVDVLQNVGYLKRSVFGMDEATPAERTIDSAGYEDVAILQPGESYEMTVMTDSSPEPRTIRLTYSSQPEENQ